MTELPIGYKWYDGKKIITTEQNFKKKGIPTGKSDNPEMFKAMTQKIDSGVYDLPLRDLNKAFCRVHSKGVVEQFKGKEDFFARREVDIEDARVYKFKDKFFPLMIEHNQNDIGFRPMPNNNMWIEVPLQFGKVQIAGIHLLRVYVNDQDEFAYQVYPDDLIPAGYDQEAISIFVTGLADDVSFYNYFLLEKIGKYDKLKPESKYVCPHCNTPLQKFKGTNHYFCKAPDCVVNNQNKEIIVYDMDDYKTKKVFKIMNMKDIWRVEDRIRLFVSNFLDYLDEPEVKVIVNMNAKDLAKRNEKRARRGKPPLPPIRIITVDGELKRYVRLVEGKCRTIDVARNETWVDGHFFRFWSRDKWCNLYAWIKKCKTDDEIRKRLKERVRRDKDGHPLPQSQQYRWDSRNKVIKVHKRAYVKWKGMGEPVERIKVVDVE